MARFDTYTNTTTLTDTDEFIIWQDGEVKNILKTDLVSDLSELIGADLGLEPDDTVPEAITDFIGQELFSSIMLQWVPPSNVKLGRIELYRSATSDFADAALIGSTIPEVTLYTDTPPEAPLAAHYWYWAKPVSAWDIDGPVTSCSNNPLSTSADPATVLEIISGQITESELYNDLNDRIDLIDTPTTGLVSKVGGLETYVETLDDGLMSLTSTVNALSAAVAGLSEAPLFDIGTTYASGDLVQYDGRLYKAKEATTGNLPTNATYWEDLGDFSSLAEVVAKNSADITELNTVSAESGSALARNVSQLNTTVGGHTTSIETNAASIDGLKAQYTVKIDNNGFMSGYGLASDASTGTPFSEFYAQVDRFAVINPAATPVSITSITRSGSVATVTATSHGVLANQYIVVTGAAQSEYNGTHKVITVETGTFTFDVSGSPATPATIASGYSGLKFHKTKVPFTVQDGATYIDTAMIKDATITDAKIGTVGTDKLFAGTTLITEGLIANGAITNAKIGNIIQSVDVNGNPDNIWSIDKRGAIEAKNITIRDSGGNIILSSGGDFANSIRNSSITINSDGTLSGAGSGQVSLTGLGFTGAYDATRNQIYRQSTAPTSGMTTGDFWIKTTSPFAIYQWNGTSWFKGGDITGENTAAAISGQGAFATLSQITSANISTYVAGAAITNAYIGNTIEGLDGQWKIDKTGAIDAKSIIIRDTSNNIILSSGGGQLPGTFIADAAISEAKIGTAQVSTLKIGENAVTVPVSAYTSGSISVGSSTLVQSTASTDFGGGSVVVNFGFTAYASQTDPYTSNKSFSVMVKRGSTTILGPVTVGSVATNVDGGSYRYGYAAYFGSIVDSPGTGSYAYNLYVGDVGDGIDSVSCRSMTVLGVKR